MANYKEMAVPPNQERITVGQIPPGTTSNALAEFLFQQTGKDSFQGPDGLSLPIFYHQTFTSLREMALSQQERLLVSFFTEKVEGFPNGEEFGKELAKINNIHWFRPNQEPNPETLQRLVQDFLERLNYPSRPSTPLKIIRENWGEVLDATKNVWYVTPWVPRGVAMGRSRGVAGGAAYSVAKVTSRPARQAAFAVANYAARQAAQEPALEATWEATRTPARDAAWDTTWKKRWMSGAEGIELKWYEDWKAVYAKAWGATPSERQWGADQEKALYQAKYGFLDATWYPAWQVAFAAVEDVAWDATQDATWIVVKDLMPARGFSKGNPLEPIMEIYKLGYWPIGPVINKETGIKEFLVFVPPVVSPTGNR